MSSDSRINGALERMVADQRITVWDIGLYLAILNRWYENGFKNSFNVSRSSLMKFAHIGSIATYHKCIKQLTTYGYIVYNPSYNPMIGTTITLLNTY